jgi:hypothetical protein
MAFPRRSSYDAARAFKGMLPRLVCAGDAEDTDVYAAQLDAPLLAIELPFQQEDKPVTGSAFASPTDLQAGLTGPPCPHAVCATTSCIEAWL